MLNLVFDEIGYHALNGIRLIRLSLRRSLIENEEYFQVLQSVFLITPSF